MMSLNKVHSVPAKVADQASRLQAKGLALRQALLFEAESIQAYLHGTNRLRDAVGASQIVDSICGSIDAGVEGDDLLSRVLRAAMPSSKPGDVTFSRRGGGAFIAFFNDVATRDRVRSLWALALDHEAPGLAWTDVAAQGATDLEAAQASMKAMREARLWRAPEFPELGPLVMRAPRTGAAAVSSHRIGSTDELVDSATLAKQEAGREASLITQRFMPEDTLQHRIHWPTRLSADSDAEADDLSLFPMGTEQNELAFLHADGNGLGAALQALSGSLARNPGEYAKVYASFSAAISRATVAAVREATAQVLIPACDELGRVPARPLVLGGDDLSIIIRPDLATDFAESFLNSFERQSKQELAPFVDRGCPERLTAACGIAVVHVRHPFARAAALSEWLCGEAKNRVKRVFGSAGTQPASIMLHRETTSLPADDDDWLAGHTFRMPGAPLRTLSLQGGPYLLDGTHDDRKPMRRLASLRKLADLLAGESVSTSGIREALGQLSEQHGDAACLRTWQRWREALARRDASALSAIDAVLRELRVDKPDLSPFGSDTADRYSTPLVDAMLLASWR